MITPIRVPKYIAGLHTRVPKKNRKIVVMTWLEADGNFVADGQAVVILDTRKAAIEMVAPASGLLFHLVEKDVNVNIGDILGVVAESAEEFQACGEYDGGGAVLPR
ncbi:MAG: hypothetical protein P4L55_06070 [Syntrophobacteraceae bacterium]|nr:hypothetical protein [Syntrophobacteraceae bacterium]